MKRLYYLSDDLDSTEVIAEQLKDTGITDWHYSVYCRHPERLTTRQVHRAGPLQRLDIVHSAERGALIGVSFGMIVGGLLWFLNTPGYPVDMAQFGFISSLSCLLGIAFGGIAGLSQRNYKIAPFQDAIDQGEQLILIDVREAQKAEVEKLMDRHSHARKVGEGSTISNPFRDFDLETDDQQPSNS